jgi:hypothetical protein
MRNKGKKIEDFSVTFRFRGPKAEAVAEALFIQWLDGGMADGFEDYVFQSEGLDLAHDWDPNTRVFEITTSVATQEPAK